MKIAQTSTHSVALVYSYKFWNSWEVHKDVLRLLGGHPAAGWGWTGTWPTGPSRTPGVLILS